MPASCSCSPFLHDYKLLISTFPHDAQNKKAIDTSMHSVAVHMLIVQVINIACCSKEETKGMNRATSQEPASWVHHTWCELLIDRDSVPVQSFHIMLRIWHEFSPPHVHT